MAKSYSLDDELAVAQRRLNQQIKSVAEDEAFLADEKAVKQLPATAVSVRNRLKRTRAAMLDTQAIVNEIVAVKGKLI